MFRRALIATAVVLAFVAATGSASSTSISPCRQVSLPTWSPDGTQIAYYGRRWPPPTTPHRGPNDILQALCTMNADGTNAQPLRYTVCSSNCSDPPGQFVWLQDGILFLRDGAVFRIAAGSKPQRVAGIPDFSFVVDAAGDRIASGAVSCPRCRGPVWVISLATGRVLRKVGGTKLDNVDPSLSADGTRVVFQRDAADDSGKTFGIWTANTDGSHLRRLAKVGQHPLWSPAGGKVAYVAFAGKAEALRLISAGGGRSRSLVPRNVENVFGWSPDGHYIAFETGTGTLGKLAVVNVATGKVSRLLPLRYAPTASWSPDSSELVANSEPRNRKCWSTWRVPIDGSTSTRISSCSN